MSSKKEKLEQLDSLVLDKMLEIMKSTDEDKMRTLSDLTVPMNYLRNNQVLADKPKSTIETDVKKRLEEAKKRRKENKPQ